MTPDDRDKILAELHAIRDALQTQILNADAPIQSRIRQLENNQAKVTGIAIALQVLGGIVLYLINKFTHA